MSEALVDVEQGKRWRICGCCLAEWSWMSGKMYSLVRVWEAIGSLVFELEFGAEEMPESFSRAKHDKVSSRQCVALQWRFRSGS